jgi:hypothetical protein
MLLALLREEMPPFDPQDIELFDPQDIELFEAMDWMAGNRTASMVTQA